MRIPAILLFVAVAACKGGGDSESTPIPPPPNTTQTLPPSSPVAKAHEIFSTRCTPCHGPSGHGDGPASAGLNPKPRNFSDPTWQASVDDAHIQKIIQYGGSAVGKSPAMPGNPDLSDPTVVAALKDVVRGLGKN